MKTNLAIHGGTPIRHKPFKSQIWINDDDRASAMRVLVNGKLSGYRANKEGQHGGPEIKKLKNKWSRMFGVDYVVPCNSATSGLFLCLESLGLQQKHAVDVTPYSMTCSASLVTKFCHPNFNDVDTDFYQMEYGSSSVAKIPVSLFGHPLTNDYRYYGAIIIEDSAQCVSQAVEHFDFRVHSFTEGKHITCGEGGLVTTNDMHKAREIEKIMNHAESVNHDIGIPSTLVGYNLRMTELQAALVHSQLYRLADNIIVRQENVQYLNENLANLGFIQPGAVDERCEHSYYCAPFHYLRGDVHRDVFIEAVKAELSNIRINKGYIKPLYKLPCFGERKHLRNVEQLWRNELFLILDIAYPHTIDDMKDIVTAFKKVADNVQHLS